MYIWEAFWNIVWLVFLTFAFVSYLFALVAILSDIFGDPKLSGWGKAVWTFFLIFFPFITALIYLVARGSGMAHRGQERAYEREYATENYIRQVVSTGPAEEISRGAELLKAGTINEEEFAQIKAAALSR